MLKFASPRPMQGAGGLRGRRIAPASRSRTSMKRISNSQEHSSPTTTAEQALERVVPRPLTHTDLTHMALIIKCNFLIEIRRTTPRTHGGRRGSRARTVGILRKTMHRARMRTSSQRRTAPTHLPPSIPAQSTSPSSRARTFSYIVFGCRSPTSRRTRSDFATR